MQALWMVAGAFCFATMGVFVKYLAPYFTTPEVVFYRGLIGMLMLWVINRSSGLSLKTTHPWMHVWRSVVGVTAMGCWFYSIAHLPLASAMTFNYMSSLWMAAFFFVGALWTLTPWHKGTRRPLNMAALVTILVGFIGVVLVLRPSPAAQETAGLAGATGLLSGLLAALAFLQVSALARAGEPESRTVFYYCVGCAVGGGAIMGATGDISAWPGVQGALWLVPMGVFAALGQLCMTRAYSKAGNTRATLVVANLQYSGLIFASIYSLALFDDHIDTLGWLGMALVTASSIAATTMRATSSAQKPKSAPIGSANTFKTT